MRKQHPGSPDPIESKPPSGSEIDYSPKTYTLTEDILSFGKMFAIAAIIVALLWIFERSI